MVLDFPLSRDDGPIAATHCVTAAFASSRKDHSCAHFEICSIREGCQHVGICCSKRGVIS